MSYALDSKASQDAKRSADFNHFVVFDPYNTIACHDFEVHSTCAPLGTLIASHTCTRLALLWPRT